MSKINCSEELDKIANAYNQRRKEELGDNCITEPGLPKDFQIWSLNGNYFKNGRNGNGPQPILSDQIVEELMKTQKFPIMKPYIMDCKDGKVVASYLAGIYKGQVVIFPFTMILEDDFDKSDTPNYTFKLDALILGKRGFQISRLDSKGFHPNYGIEQLYTSNLDDQKGPSIMHIHKYDRDTAAAQCNAYYKTGRLDDVKFDYMKATPVDLSKDEIKENGSLKTALNYYLRVCNIDKSLLSDKYKEPGPFEDKPTKIFSELGVYNFAYVDDLYEILSCMESESSSGMNQ